MNALWAKHAAVLAARLRAVNLPTDARFGRSTEPALPVKAVWQVAPAVNAQRAPPKLNPAAIAASGAERAKMVSGASGQRVPTKVSASRALSEPVGIAVSNNVMPNVNGDHAAAKANVQPERSPAAASADSDAAATNASGQNHAIMALERYIESVSTVGGRFAVPKETGVHVKVDTQRIAELVYVRTRGSASNRKDKARSKKVGLSTKLSKREEGIDSKETAFRARLETVHLICG